jgi:hypothetical protein
MASEDEGQRTELTRQERERRATIPLLRRLVSEQHHQQHQRCEADARSNDYNRRSTSSMSTTWNVCISSQKPWI